MYWLNKTLIQFYRSQILIGLGCFFLTLFHQSLLQLYDFNQALIAGVLCFVSYNFQVFFSRRQYVNLLLCMVGVLFLGKFYLHFFIEHEYSWVFVLLGLVSLLYVPAFRKLHYVKTPTIALSWGMLQYLLFKEYAVLFFCSTFSLIFATTLLFDLRDRVLDLGQIKTIAHLTTPSKITLLSLFFYLLFSFMILQLSNHTALVLGLLFGVVLLVMGYKKRAHVYYYVFLDLLPGVFYFVSLCI